MHYYLCGWVGDGTDASPFEPEITTGQWSVIDLRPDPSVVDGACLLATTVRPASDPGGSVYLGDTTTGAMPMRVKKQIENRLGLSGITAEDLPRIVAELLIDHARTDGTRWWPLQPRSRGANSWEIHLGGILWKVARVAGGATYTESFTGTDGSLATGNRTDLTWSIVSGAAWEVLSNQASPNGALHGDVAYARAEHDTASSNMYVEATVTTISTSTDQFGPCARFAPAANDSYMAMLQGDSTMTLRKTVGGSRTNLSSATAVTIALPQVARTEIDGSTLTGFWDGAEIVSVTDTSIAGNTRAGLYSDEGAGDTVIDDFEFGDLTAGGATGTLAGTLPAVTADLSGTVTATGALSGTLPTITADLSGTHTATGSLSGTLPTLTAELTGSVGEAVTGSLAGTLPTITADLAGTQTTGGSLAGTLPSLTADLTAEQTATGDLAGTLPAITADLTGTVDTGGGVLSAALPPITGSLAGQITNSGTLDASLPGLTTDIDGTVTADGSLAGTLPALTADLAGQVDIPGGQLAGTLPALTADLAGAVTLGGALDATLPALTGGLDATVTATGSLDATLPALVAALTTTPRSVWPPSAGAPTTRQLATAGAPTTRSIIEAGEPH